MVGRWIEAATTGPATRCLSQASSLLRRSVLFVVTPRSCNVQFPTAFTFGMSYDVAAGWAADSVTGAQSRRLPVGRRRQTGSRNSARRVASRATSRQSTAAADR